MILGQILLIYPECIHFQGNSGVYLALQGNLSLWRITSNVSSGYFGSYKNGFDESEIGI